VKSRFGPAHAALTYPGDMLVKANWLGLIFAHVLRLIGTPLAPWQGEAVPVDVFVHPDRRGGVVWDRRYLFPGRAALRVSSRKVMSEDGTLAEVVAGGLGMRLLLTAEHGALVFDSCGYFLELFGWRAPIPLLATPGRARVTHEDCGGGAFRFTLSFDHPWAGRTIFQTGLFRDPETP
jgi:hypothetical protein